MKATDLRQALNILDPERPLRTAEELRDYFVARPMSPLADLTLLLEDATTPQKFLFTGHRGTGKSTELAKLTHDLGERLFVVHYSIKSVLNLFDLTYVDVLLSLGLELFRQTTQRGVAVKEEVLDHVLNFTKQITKETETGVTTQGDVGAELNLVVAKLSSKLGTEDRTRAIVREQMNHRLSDLLEGIDLLSREVERATRQRILIIVEDLDKADLQTVKQLFRGHATSLLAPPVSVVYTFPTELRHDNDFMQVQMNFPNLFILPNLKTRSRDGEPEPNGLEGLRQILTKRVEERLFTGEGLTALAELSSGIPRELIALARRACLEAIKADQPAIDGRAVERAARAKRMDYEVLLTAEQRRLLAAVHETKRIENDEAHRALLHNLSALEYRNDVGVWYDVHPLIKPLIVEGS